MIGPHGSTRQSGRDTQTGGENLGPYLNRVIWSLAALSTLFVGLRVYCKLLRRRQLWWDDHILVASWVALVASIALQSAGVAHGLGRHFAELDAEAITAVSLYSICAGFGSILATCWSKTSFAISLLRISTGGMRAFIWFIIITVNLVLGSNGLVQWIQCWPIQKRWYYEMEGTCFPSQIVQNYNTFFAAYSGLMDIVLALLPWKIIWTVAINKREKLGALVLMSVGVIAGVMAFLKIKTVYVIGNDNATTVDLFIFGTAEPATAIMAASIPVLRTLIRRKHHHPKPARFIELGDNRLKVRSAPAAVHSSSGGGGSVHTPIVRDDDEDGREAGWTPATPNTLTAVTTTKISHLEKVRVRERGSGEGDEELGGCNRSTEGLTEGFGNGR